MADKTYTLTHAATDVKREDTEYHFERYFDAVKDFSALVTRYDADVETYTARVTLSLNDGWGRAEEVVTWSKD